LTLRVTAQLPRAPTTSFSVRGDVAEVHLASSASPRRGESQRRHAPEGSQRLEPPASHSPRRCELGCRIFIGDADKWHHTPLDRALIERLRREGFAGATSGRSSRSPSSTSAHARSLTSESRASRVPPGSPSRCAMRRRLASDRASSSAIATTSTDRHSIALLAALALGSSRHPFGLRARARSANAFSGACDERGSTTSSFSASTTCSPCSSSTRLRAALKHIGTFGANATLATTTEAHTPSQRSRPRSGTARCRRGYGGLRRIGSQVLRHTFCSHLAMRGAPPKAIQELAGHSTLAMTLR
jgi:Phage integrase family/Uncharacterized ACR, COG1993